MQQPKPPLEFIQVLAGDNPILRVGEENPLSGKIVRAINQTPMGLVVEHEDKSAGIFAAPHYAHFGPMPTVVKATAADVPPEKGRIIRG